MAPASRLLAAGLAALWAVGVQADGTGLIGWGKTLYNPTCSFACRNVIRRQPLLCTPEDSTENHGTAHNPVTTPPDCFIKDHAFLTTMALCIDTYCPLAGNPSTELLEDYWAGHLGTGTLGTDLWTPVMSYQDALSAAREAESEAEDGRSNSTSSRIMKRQHGSHSGETDYPGLVTFDVSSPLPLAAGGTVEMLNVTSFVSPELWQLQYNYMYDFETNEAGHSTMTIVVTIVAIFLPLALSLLRFLPALTRSRGWTYIQSLIIHPAAMGHRHREPVAGVGLVPNRGQTLYILLISGINLFLWPGPYVIHQPQASFASLKMQTISIVGNRAGVMAMGNAVALFLFAGRNNVLLYLTDWSYSTYLLLHRWLGYWCIFHTIVHSFMLLANYVLQGSYEAELAREYWVWGIVGTVAVCAILPFSVLWIRRHYYEAFVGMHIVLSLLFIIGYYYHIWFLYEYNWGYEIWAFVIGGIWGLERVIRIARTVVQGGSRTAIVTTVPGSDGEYLRIEVEGKRFDSGVAYLAFPTVGYRPWETHPFSVAYSTAPGIEQPTQASVAGAPAADKAVNVSSAEGADPEKGANSPSSNSSTTGPVSKTDSTVFFTRTRTGMTKQIAARAQAAAGQPLRLRVLVEGPYHHSGRVESQISQCTSLLCIAGGVGITACLPFLRRGASASTKLFWSSRQEGLVAALAPALAELPSSVAVETAVGSRLDLGAILAKELAVTDAEGERGPVAVVVCGPPAMADEVRKLVVQVARTDAASRPFVLVDEAFGW